MAHEPMKLHVDHIAADAAESGRRDDELQEHAETREFLDVLLSEVSEEDRILLTLKVVPPETIP